MKTKRTFSLFMTALLIATGTLTSCASMNSGENQTEENVQVLRDPYEDYNRRAFRFNQGVDDVFINPIVRGYQTVVPAPARTGVDNALRNLNTPTVLLNQLLQGDLEGAGNALVRGIVNTFVGVGGIFDVAAKEGIEHEYEDFGQTLAVWGVDNGPYLVVPLLGPSTARDYAGFFVDSFTDPLRWYLFNIEEDGLYYGKTGMTYLSLRSSLIDVLTDLENNSIDYYAATRSTYFQRRNALIADQKGQSQDTIAEFPEYDDF